MTLAFSEASALIKTVEAGRDADFFSRRRSRPFPSARALLAGADRRFSGGRKAQAGVRWFFTKYDVLLCPINPITAPPRGLQQVTVKGVEMAWTHVMRATAPFNLTGPPALSVPYGLGREGLPIGMQLVAGWSDEETLLSAGGLIERRGGLGDRRPVL